MVCNATYGKAGARARDGNYVGCGLLARWVLREPGAMPVTPRGTTFDGSIQSPASWHDNGVTAGLSRGLKNMPPVERVYLPQADTAPLNFGPGNVREVLTGSPVEAGE